MRNNLIRCILQQCDILICEETILPSQFNSLLHNTHKDFKCLIKPNTTSDNLCDLDERRPAVIFKIFSNNNCDLIYSNDNFRDNRVTFRSV